MALYLWEDLTEEQVKDVIRETDATCVIPLGSMAMHGQHSPMGTDCIIAESIVRMAAERESICLFPTLWMGCALNPYDHAGQINLSRPLIHEMLEEIVAEVTDVSKLLVKNGDYIYYSTSANVLKRVKHSMLVQIIPIAILPLPAFLRARFVRSAEALCLRAHAAEPTV